MRYRFASRLFGILIISAIVSVAATETFASSNNDGIKLNQAPFGKTEDGTDVDLYTLENANGVKIGIMTYGGIIQTIQAPDKEGNMDDITLGFDTLEGYLAGHPYFGALVGRYANRIANGKFTLNGKEYSLFINNGPNALHGGEQGFDKKVWDADIVDLDGIPGLKLTYVSEDEEEGYPGTLISNVFYSLNNDNELKIEYMAVTDQATVLNLTNHAYFNLGGHKNMEEITDHVLTLNADLTTPVDETLIPTGEIVSVKNSPFDFTTPHPIGERIDAEHDQITKGGGYDHNFVLNKPEVGVMTFGGRVVDPESGRVLEFHTTQPGVQFYTGNFLDGSLKGKNGQLYKHRFGFCLETQHFPDSPNQPHFPSVVLNPDEQYHQVTIYKFTTE